MKKAFAFLSIVILTVLASRQIHAGSEKPRVWIDVTHQSPNIFTNGDCPKDHPVQLGAFEPSSIGESVGHAIRVCGQIDADGIHIKETDLNGNPIKSAHTVKEFERH